MAESIEIKPYQSAISEMQTTLQNSINSYWQTIYPVGAIYISVNSTSPATLFGGTWEALRDRFLIGAGNSYAVNGTGGQTSVSYTPAGSNSGGSVGNTTLTTNQIPSHNHTFTGSSATSGNQSAGHTHTYTDYYATTTGNCALTVAQLASHNHPTQGWTGCANGDDKHCSGRYRLPNDAVVSGDSSIVKNNGSGNNHNHSGANTSTSRTSNGISANHTHTLTAKGSIGNSGGGGAHNHGFTNPSFSGTKATIATMPPYLAVYMWKRTA